jgi:23S rRNA pseudouridine2605 synthase
MPNNTGLKKFFKEPKEKKISNKQWDRTPTATRGKKNEEEKPWAKGNNAKPAFAKNTDKPYGKPAFKKGKNKYEEEPATETRSITKAMPLNKFLAYSGLGGRREVVQYITEGKIQVNAQVITEPGFKVTEKDKIVYRGKRLFIEKELVYILLNKPKDYITTTSDDRGRKTVMELIQGATSLNVFPVGRLDRNTSGVLLLTNDGVLTQKLTHPRFGVKKIYAVTTDKPVEKKDLEQLVKGIQLTDGIAVADAAAYNDIQDKTQVGVEIHSGKNRVVRRMFEAMGYDVRNLDRVLFAGLTKKNVNRGRWRFLSEKEIRLLKYFTTSK